MSRHARKDGNDERAFRRFRTRGGALSLAALAAVILAAGGLTTARLLGNEHGNSTSGLTAIGVPGTTGGAQPDSIGAMPASTPQAVSGPHSAAMPRGHAKGTPKAKPSQRPSGSGAAASGGAPGTGQSSSPAWAPANPGSSGGSGGSGSVGGSGGSSGSGSSAGSGGSGGSASAPPPAAPASSTSCQHPVYTTSDPNGMWNQAPYFVANDAWNAGNYNVSQTLYACSYSNWYVKATMDNSKGDGAVKTYPNSHRDFDNSPKISSFSSITSTFAETSPGTGIYEDAYDIWLNGIGGDNSTEVMIWTENHGQTPSGSPQGTVTLGGHTYTAYKTSGNYIAFVPTANFTSGTMNLLGFFQWLMSKGWISSGATLGQVDYGVELVSTNGTPATFTFSNFSVNAS